MRAETKRKIGDFTYTVQYLDPESAMDLVNEYLAIIGPVMGAVAVASASGDTERSMAPELASALKQLSPETLKRHRRLIESVTMFQNAQGVGGWLKDNPEHFRGRLLDHYEMFVWGMQVQLGDFFGSAMTRFGTLFPGFAMAGKEQVRSIHPAESGGLSGG